MVSKAGSFNIHIHRKGCFAPGSSYSNCTQSLRELSHTLCSRDQSICTSSCTHKMPFSPHSCVPWSICWCWPDDNMIKPMAQGLDSISQKVVPQWESYLSNPKDFNFLTPSWDLISKQNIPEVTQGCHYNESTEEPSSSKGMLKNFTIFLPHLRNWSFI